MFIDIFNKAKLDNLIDKNKFLGYLICHFGILFEFCIMFDIVILLITMLIMMVVVQFIV